MDEAWRTFEMSGRITDYLKFKQSESGNALTAAFGDQQEERPNGTEYRSDRNGLKSNADWRL